MVNALHIEPAQWLEPANPGHADLWWESTGFAIIEAGSNWEAVKVSHARGRTALQARISGPVVHDPLSDVLYFLVPEGTAAHWSVEGTDCLARECYIAIPDPLKNTPPDPYWAQRPTSLDNLIDAGLLKALLEEAA